MASATKYGLDIKFITTHIPIRNFKLVKCMKMLTFCRKNTSLDQSAQMAKTFEKKLSLGVCSLWPQPLVPGTYLPNKLHCS